MWTCDFYRYKHIYTYRRKGFQSIFGKRNYAIGLENCFLFTKKSWTMEMSIILTVLLEFA